MQGAASSWCIRFVWMWERAEGHHTDSLKLFVGFSFSISISVSFSLYLSLLFNGRLNFTFHFVKHEKINNKRQSSSFSEQQLTIDSTHTHNADSHQTIFLHAYFSLRSIRICFAEFQSWPAVEWDAFHPNANVVSKSPFHFIQFCWKIHSIFDRPIILYQIKNTKNSHKYWTFIYAKYECTHSISPQKNAHIAEHRCLSAEWELIYAPCDLRNETGKYLKGKRTRWTKKNEKKKMF